MLLATSRHTGDAAMTTSDIARALFNAFARQDRAAAEALIAEDFRFTSPLDNGLDRQAYFNICWPNSERIENFELKHVAQDGSCVLVTYEALAGAKRFRNTEVMTISDHRITAVEVYFGWNVPHDVPPGKHRG